MDSLKRYLKKKGKESWRNSKRIHSVWLRKEEGWLRLGISILVLIFISWSLLDTDWKLGFSFIFAGSMAIYSGLIYKSRDVMILVLIGVILGTVVPTLIPSLWESYSNGDYIGAVFLLGLGIVIWLWSSTLKKGNIPQDWSEKRKVGKVKRRRR